MSQSIHGRRWMSRSMGAGSAQALVTQLAQVRNVTLGKAVASLPGQIWQFSAMPLAIARLEQALQAHEKIGIFGDYDCDGVTATALLLRLLRRRGVEPVVRLPNRLTEGYGLKMHQVEALAAAGVQLLLTADTGIASAAEVQTAKRLGMEVMIFDHHHVPAVLPDATVIVHPMVESGFPNPHPAAAGVCYEFVRSFEAAQGTPVWSGWQEDAALGALGTVADVVELRGGNRLLVQLGLQAFGQITTGPLAHLRERAGIEGAITSRDLAFRLAPRINAAGRMADPAVALAALLGSTEALETIEQLNQNRQDVVRDIVEAVLRDLQTTEPVLCLKDHQYSPGICGLIAGRLTESTGKPSLVAHQRDDGVCMASLRSPAAYHVTEGLERVAQHLLTYGGHAAAAGCTFRAEEFMSIQSKLSADVVAHVDLAELVPTQYFDATILPGQVSVPVIESLAALEPFGQGNPEPVFLCERVMCSDLRVVGRDASHLQCRLGGLKAIGFGLAKHQALLQKPVDVLVKLDINEWQGKRDPQAQIVDVRLAL